MFERGEQHEGMAAKFKTRPLTITASPCSPFLYRPHNFAPVWNHFPPILNFHVRCALSLSLPRLLARSRW